MAFSKIACLEVWGNARKPQRLTFVKKIKVQDSVFTHISVVKWLRGFPISQNRLCILDCVLDKEQDKFYFEATVELL